MYCRFKMSAQKVFNHFVFGGKCGGRYRLMKNTNDIQNVPWWIGPFTEINWIDAKDPRGAENGSAMDEKPSQSYCNFKTPRLFVLHTRHGKMSWQPLFIPLNKSSFFSELKCLLITLGLKQEQMQLFKWMNLICLCYYMRDMCGNLDDSFDHQSGNAMFVYLLFLDNLYKVNPLLKHQVSVW